MDRKIRKYVSKEVVNIIKEQNVSPKSANSKKKKKSETDFFFFVGVKVGLKIMLSIFFIFFS